VLHSAPAAALALPVRDRGQPSSSQA
jgi:hypothetical protein